MPRPALLLALALTACAAGDPPPATPPPPAADPAPVPVAVTTAAAPPAAPPPKGDTPAPAVAAPDPPAAPPGGVAGANLTMGSMEADGVRLEGVACKVEGALGLLGAIVLAAGFSQRRTQLDACAHGKAQRTTVAWTAAGGVMSKVKADGPDAATARCVEKALAGAPAPLPATCSATLVQGKSR